MAITCITLVYGTYGLRSSRPQKDKSSLIDARGGGGDSAYEGGTDARRKF